MLPREIESKLVELATLCKRHRVAKLFVFGSAATGAFDSARSDIDLVVELENLPPLARGENLISLWDALEQLFARRVDLISDFPVENPYLRNSINKTKRLLYSGKREKILR